MSVLLAADMQLPSNGQAWDELRDVGPRLFDENRSNEQILTHEMHRVICALMHPDPSNRPSAKDVLELDLVRFSDPIIPLVNARNYYSMLH